MSLPNGGGGYQIGAGNLNEVYMGSSLAPATATVTATLTARQVTSQLLVANPGAAAAVYTLPTAALIEEIIPNATPGNTFDLNIVNLGNTSGTVTLALGTGLTDGGNALTAIPIASSAGFRFRKTGDAAWAVYKIA